MHYLSYRIGVISNRWLKMVLEGHPIQMGPGNTVTIRFDFR